MWDRFVGVLWALFIGLPQLLWAWITGKIKPDDFT